MTLFGSVVVFETAADMASSSTTAAGSRDDGAPRPAAYFRRNEDNKRFVFEYNGRSIYQWEQTLDEVILYVPAPPAHAKVACTIDSSRVRLGLHTSTQYMIDEATYGKVDIEESTWTLEDGNVVIYLQKANKGLVWESALLGRRVNESIVAAVLDPFQLEQVKQELLLERWQAENPGMDFRDAKFNGATVPDPRTYMGGVKYD